MQKRFLVPLMIFAMLPVSSQAIECQLDSQAPVQSVRECLTKSMQDVLTQMDIPHHDNELSKSQKEMLDDQIHFALHSEKAEERTGALNVLHQVLIQALIQNQADWNKISDDGQTLQIFQYIFDMYLQLMQNKLQDAQEEPEQQQQIQEHGDQESLMEQQQLQKSPRATAPAMLLFYDDMWEEHVNTLPLTQKEKVFFKDNLRQMTLQYFIKNMQNQNIEKNEKSILKDVQKGLEKVWNFAERWANRKKEVLPLAKELILSLHNRFFAPTICQSNLNMAMIARLIQYAYHQKFDAGLLFQKFIDIWKDIAFIENFSGINIDKEIKNFFMQYNTSYAISTSSIMDFIYKTLAVKSPMLKKHPDAVAIYVLSYIDMLKNTHVCRNKAIGSLIKEALGEASNAEVIQNLGMFNQALKELKN